MSPQGLPLILIYTCLINSHSNHISLNTRRYNQQEYSSTYTTASVTGQVKFASVVINEEQDGISNSIVDISELENDIIDSCSDIESVSVIIETVTEFKRGTVASLGDDVHVVDHIEHGPTHLEELIFGSCGTRIII